MYANLLFIFPTGTQKCVILKIQKIQTVKEKMKK